MSRYSETDYTDWFDGKLYVPLEKGVYERISSHHTKTYSYWNGEYWEGNSTEVYIARFRGFISCFQDWNFRGLKLNPLDPMKYVVAA